MTSAKTTDSALCLLTLLAPLACEDALLDVLDHCPELHAGYTLLSAQGLGAGAHLHSLMEQVQGRARRLMMQAVVRLDERESLLQRLHQQLPNPEIIYWFSPLLEQGRLA
jgi:hypothetical protein